MKPYLKLLSELHFTEDQLENVAWKTASSASMESPSRKPPPSEGAARGSRTRDFRGH